MSSSNDVALPPPPEEAVPAAFDEISSPNSAQILEFCDSDLLPGTINNPEVTSGSNICYDDDNSYTANLCFDSELDEKFSYKLIDINHLQTEQPDYTYNSTTTATTSSNSTATTAVPNAITSSTIANNNSLFVIYDSQEDIDYDISASIDFSPSPPLSAAPPHLSMVQLDFSSQLPLAVAPFSCYPADDMIPQMAASQLPPVYEEDCSSQIQPFLQLMNPQAAPISFLDRSVGSFYPNHMNPAFGADYSCLLTHGTIFGGQQLQPEELDYLADSGAFRPDKIQNTYTSGDLQLMRNENQQLVSAPASSTPSETDASTTEDSTVKPGKLTPEERKERIHRYMKKRNERNFSKKIKYACRKTLADSRPRVRGRFAKNEELREFRRRNGGHHEDDIDYDEVNIKEEDDMTDSTDVYAHIGDMNSFKCGYPIQYWT
ncbi:hypothetical protein Drorol1_Dr00015421 [Drosera rotundifolia]